MKTLTEFAAMTIKNAAKTMQELTAAGKTAEELPAALGEALKLEGDKLTYLMHALEAVGEKTNELKRVVVQALNEGEKAPSIGKLLGDKYYTVEFYQAMRQQQASEDDKGRGDKRGGKRGDKRGGGRDGDKRGPGGPGRGGERSAGGPSGIGAGGAPGAPGGRGPRPAASAGPVAKPNIKPVITPKGAAAPKADSAPAQSEES